MKRLEIDTSSDAWRHECEARHVIGLDKASRQRYYQGVAEKRGDAAAKALIAEVKRQWEASK